MPNARKIARFAAVELEAKSLTVKITFTESAGKRAGEIRAFAHCEAAGLPKPVPIELSQAARDLVIGWFQDAIPGFEVGDLTPPPVPPPAPDVVLAPTFAIPQPSIEAPPELEPTRPLTDEEIMEALGRKPDELKPDELSQGDVVGFAVPVEGGRGGDTQPPPLDPQAAAEAAIEQAFEKEPETKSSGKRRRT